MSQSQANSGFAEINGIRMYYEIYGSGKPLELIHGGGSTIQTTFGRLIPQLQDSFQIIAVELQGHGHSSDRNAELSFEQDAEDVAALLKSLKIENADILAFSNGATTSLYLAAKYPQLCNKVIAASGLYKRDGVFPGFWDFMKNAKLEQMPQAYQDAFMAINKDSVKLQNMHDKCARRMLNFQDVSDEVLKSVKSPVMLVSGDKDVPTVEHTASISRLIPHAQMAILPGGHGDFLGEITAASDGSAAFLPLLRNFLLK